MYVSWYRLSGTCTRAMALSGSGAFSMWHILTFQILTVSAGSVAHSLSFTRIGRLLGLGKGFFDLILILKTSED